MDNPHYASLLALFKSARGYMGPTWIRAVESNLTSLYSQLAETSLQSAANLAIAVEAENHLKAVREELTELRKAAVEPATEVVTLEIPSNPVEPIIVEDEENAAHAKNHDGRCTVESCKALGIVLPIKDGKEVTPRVMADSMEFARASGLNPMPFGARNVETDPYFISGKCTLKEFVQCHPEGKYYISTSGHAMALVDGVLTDTENKGPDGRKVVGAFTVE